MMGRQHAASPRGGEEPQKRSMDDHASFLRLGEGQRGGAEPSTSRPATPHPPLSLGERAFHSTPVMPDLIRHPASWAAKGSGTPDQVRGDEVGSVFTRHPSVGWGPCLSQQAVAFVQRDMDASLRWHDDEESMQ